jgi:hypothetical protein
MGHQLLVSDDTTDGSISVLLSRPPPNPPQQVIYQVVGNLAFLVRDDD